MTTINIPVSDDNFAQLQRLAEKAGQTPEEFLQLRVEQILFEAAADYVLQKNAELYRKLA